MLCGVMDRDEVGSDVDAFRIDDESRRHDDSATPPFQPHDSIPASDFDRDPVLPRSNFGADA